jgi:YihY family inner membrane protein
MRPAIAPRNATLKQRRFGERSAYILKSPGGFALGVLSAFRKNQGLLLAGAVAYYTLLSLIPLLILMLIALSHVIDQARLLATMTEYLEFIVPGQSEALVGELRAFLEHGQVIGGVLLLTMVFFSALAFTVLENAMSVIFYHRVAVRRRRFVVSALLPYLFIIFLGLGLLVVTIVAGKLGALATHNITVFGVPHSLSDLSDYLLYLLGVAGEILILTAIYLVMPVGRLSLRHALIGGVTAGLLWELTRHLLGWYYGTMSQVRVVYGSLTTAILALLSVEIGAIFLLLGAQVIAEYERIGREPPAAPQKGLTTGGRPAPRERGT